MAPPVWDTLEAVKAVHSFLEVSAILFLVGVVGCDAALEFITNEDRWKFPVTWPRRTWNIRIGKFRWALRRPPYSDTLSLRSLIKLLSLSWFFLAIALELATHVYSERVDELSNSEFAFQQKLIGKALVTAGNAIKDAEVLRGVTQKLRRQNDATEKELANAEGQRRESEQRAANELEKETHKRLDLASSLLPRTLHDQSGMLNLLSTVSVKLVVFEINDREGSEPLHIAEEINSVVRELGWDSFRHRGDESFIREGISASTGALPLEIPIIATEAYARSQYDLVENAKLASWLLVEELNKAGIDSQHRPLLTDTKFPLTTLIVAVGVKPNHALENTLLELGTPTATPLRGNGNRESRNRLSIAEEPRPRKP